MRRLFALMLALALPIMAAGCSDGPTTVENTEFAASLGIDLDAMTRTNSGLYYQDLTVGTGAVAQAGTRVSVYYRGWLPNGLKFDERTSGTPFSFPLGQGYVIAGWDEGVAGMKVGGKRKLVIPPSLGYGSRSQGAIPANSVLVFEVDLLGVGN
jgi:FKBP-type peptidyl-prolyl cis-trans isomerase FkpA